MIIIISFWMLLERFLVYGVFLYVFNINLIIYYEVNNDIFISNRKLRL